MKVSINDAINTSSVSGMVIALLIERGVINGLDSAAPFDKVANTNAGGHGLWYQGGKGDTFYIQNVVDGDYTINFEISNNKVYYFGSKSVAGMKDNLKRFVRFANSFDGLEKSGNPVSDETRFGYKAGQFTSDYQKARRLAVAAEHMIALHKAIFA